MIDAYAHHSELTEKQYTAIGYIVRSFSVLERAMGVAALDILAWPNPLDEEPPQAKEICKATFQKRLKLFLSHYRARIRSDQWSNEFEYGVSDLGRWRDGVCHGIWEFLDQDTMRLTFFDRASADGITAIPEQIVSTKEVFGLANAANYWSYILEQKPWRNTS
ncbi:MAG: hypothetical protein QM682_15325 [Paracoccus sp. (in: a-proteobacteria)]|uniref:hypothetical protein n=1 Tax=Paracoccus sp. TaxID=267 RepID=UPI0039E24D4F